MHPDCAAVVSRSTTLAKERVREILSEQHESSGSSSGVGTATSVSLWTAACFPADDVTGSSELEELIKEAADAARDDYDAESARLWAKGYVFPASYVESDVRCLRAAQLDFPIMVRRRLKQLSGDRLSADRVARLRPDNP